jgi:hypothetical protein
VARVAGSIHINSTVLCFFLFSSFHLFMFSSFPFSSYHICIFHICKFHICIFHISYLQVSYLHIFKNCSAHEQHAFRQEDVS